MGFDLRLPIGILFSLFGLILVVYGAVTPAAMYHASLGINVNLYWGGALVVFGGTMLAFALRGQKAAAKAAQSSPQDPRAQPASDAGQSRTKAAGSEAAAAGQPATHPTDGRS